jgi:hypothetical protein
LAGRADQIKNWCSYEYFAGYELRNKPLWSEDIRKRKPVFLLKTTKNKKQINING